MSFAFISLICINPNWKESENIVLDIVDVLFGKSNASATLNMLIVLMKNFIYKQRVNKSIAGFSGFMSYLNWKEHLFEKEYDSEIWYSMEQL